MISSGPGIHHPGFYRLTNNIETIYLRITEGKFVAANPLAPYHDTWNWGFITTERMTRTLYRSLTE